MKFIIKYMHTAAIGAIFLFSPSAQSISLVTTTAWLKCKLGLSAPINKSALLDTNCRSISFESDLLDIIELYEIPQLYTHWAIQELDSMINNKKLLTNTATKEYSPDYSSQDILKNLKFYEKAIKALELDTDDTYEDACEKFIDLLHLDNDEEEIDIKRQNTIRQLFPSLTKRNGLPTTIKDIENHSRFKHIKAALHHTVLLADIFEKIARNKLTKLWKTIVIKADGVILPHNYITKIPVTEDTCTISATLPIETFAQLLDAQSLRCILSDDRIEEDNQCLVDIQTFLQEHSWIRSGLIHLQQDNSIWNSFIARYINMQIVFTYTFNIKEFESDTICINYLLLSQLNKWAQSLPTVTTRYRPFQTIEIIVNNKNV